MNYRLSRRSAPHGRIPRILLALVLAVLTATVVHPGPAAAGEPPPAFAACVEEGWSNHATSGGFAFNGINIRSGPYLSCPIRGVGDTSHSVTFYCFREGEGDTWTFLHDDTTGIYGWSRDDKLTGRGSWSPC
ncbi:hypothetical protein Lfu02_42730 [Longispora fulva]|uniref:SH3 domain-containing protein n=1 Tax=Longispora fulva TaxID=619741 RepID=A0A8J7KKH7_9ACTN|nr:hypothetical protein [Longispora fulva]MBG6136731.1 hypothetical protein [Longispora fulva]GIG59901.1 hypothetical protein Lfu02_42730 [Longispora fulva]